MIRVVDTHSARGYIAYSQWLEEQRLEAAKNARMPSSENGTYDMSQRAPQSWKQSYDFSQ
jgi:hypothetical protein